jgi:hypothetical protein
MLGRLWNTSARRVILTLQNYSNSFRSRDWRRSICLLYRRGLSRNHNVHHGEKTDIRCGVRFSTSDRIFLHGQSDEAFKLQGRFPERYELDTRFQVDRRV